ncbi:MAG: flagellar hook-basal body complex protein FliE [Gammaproteobacteria bacterium]|nr:flagellar hook-basal body complex protein FliE [Gammaproteobacteria bacterium]
MNEISPDQLLSQIRSLSKSLHAPPNVVTLESANVSTSTPTDFSQMLKNTLNAVNDVQQHAGDLKTGFADGTTDASLAEVMIAAQKADLSFRAVTEVRNKLVQAYQDIMNMPV